MYQYLRPNANFNRQVQLQRWNSNEGSTIFDLQKPRGQDPLKRRDTQRKAGPVPQHFSMTGSCAPIVAADTMKSQLQALQREEPATIFIARRINKLGFSSAELLRLYFDNYGPVKSVYVSHSRVKSLQAQGERRGSESQWRLRAAALGFVVMQDASATAQILADGPEHIVNGVAVRVHTFYRPNFTENQYNSGDSTLDNQQDQQSMSGTPSEDSCALFSATFMPFCPLSDYVQTESMMNLNDLQWIGHSKWDDLGQTYHSTEPPKVSAHFNVAAPSSTLVAADTMKAQLQALQLEDPATIFIARRINKLGFASAELLRMYFDNYGPVKGIYVSHSRVKSLQANGDRRSPDSQWRLRAAALGFVVMQDASATARILADGPEHVINGAVVRVHMFHRRTFVDDDKHRYLDEASDEHQDPFDLCFGNQLPICSGQIASRDASNFMFGSVANLSQYSAQELKNAMPDHYED
jgi:hypothetical protein